MSPSDERRSTRSTIALLTVLAAAWLCSPARSADDTSGKAAARPNILFIYADDQSYKTLSCYPESPDWVNTPHIDRLAQRGIRFERAYFGAWCMPSRASFLTGRLQHGIQTMRMEGQYPGSTYDPQLCPFIPAQFRKAGYHTAQIGKWHTGVDTGYGRDWDHQIVWSRPGHPDNAGKYFYDQILTFNGEDRLTPGYSTDNYTDWAVDYINGQHRDADKPWYLWLCYGAIHGPTTPAERHKGKLAEFNAEVPVDIFGPWPEKPSYLNDTAAWERGKDGTPVMKQKVRAASNFDTMEAGMSYRAWIQQVNECMLGVDEGVGRLMAALEASGQLENTLVVYTADQGYGLGEHGFNQKIAPYDSTLASPLIISQPGTHLQGKVCKHPVNAPDLMGFFCQTAGVTVPWRTDARDIRPLLKNPERQDWDSPMLMTHTARSYGSDTDDIPTSGDKLLSTGKTPWYAMLRHGNYKYVRTLVAGEPEELYDLAADPEELVNLALRDEHRAQLEQLRARAVNELRATQAGFVDTMPASRQMSAR